MNILSQADWFSLFLGSIVIPAGLYVIGYLIKFWKKMYPARMLFEGLCDQAEPCKIFVRDLIIPTNLKLISFDPRLDKTSFVPNIPRVYPESEGRAIGYIYNLLGQVGKTENIELIGMGEDIIGEWNSHVILLGAQAQKNFDFYQQMTNVAYKVDDEIVNSRTLKIINREGGYGYGVILKSMNPFRTGTKKGVAFLIGGYGVFGTLAAAYYFKENFKRLGKEFKKDCFGIIIRASLSAGVETAQRVYDFDERFRPPNFLAKIYKKIIGINRNASNDGSSKANGKKLIPESKISAKENSSEYGLDVAFAEETIGSTAGTAGFPTHQEISTSGTGPVSPTPKSVLHTKDFDVTVVDVQPRAKGSDEQVR